MADVFANALARRNYELALRESEERLKPCDSCCKSRCVGPLFEHRSILDHRADPGNFPCPA